MGEIYEIETSNPLCGEEEFAELVAEMVRDEAPRLFAVVQEIGEREDGRIAAWGWRSTTTPPSCGIGAHG